MKKIRLVLCALAMPLAGVSIGVRAEQLEWIISGSVSQLTQYSLDGQGYVASTKDATQIGTMRVGQQFTLDVITDSSADNVHAATFKTTDGAMSYKIMTPANGPLQMGIGTQNQYGNIWGTLTNVNLEASKPTWLSQVSVRFTMPTWNDPSHYYSGLEFFQAVSKGNYDPQVQMSAVLNMLPSGMGQLGKAQFSVSSVSVQAVPEASTWATFSLGLVALAGVVRARRAGRRLGVMA